MTTLKINRTTKRKTASKIKKKWKWLQKQRRWLVHFFQIHYLGCWNIPEFQIWLKLKGWFTKLIHVTGWMFCRTEYFNVNLGKQICKLKIFKNLGRTFLKDTSIILNILTRKSILHQMNVIRNLLIPPLSRSSSSTSKDLVKVKVHWTFLNN